MKYSEWLKRRDENSGAARVGISDIGPDSHDMVPDEIGGESPGAFNTFSVGGNDLPPTPGNKRKRIMSRKKNCNCGK